uniref:Transmembrane protein 70 homolog, mitochondrial-like n=1 Tax=Phallusia mammillata TaxID=59560 RepID=A0A6F9DW67_9ASCI|nr:transmembrane protein 70 homolog, mitochondrial-like [Phallusia mammillata]
MFSRGIVFRNANCGSINRFGLFLAASTNTTLAKFVPINGRAQYKNNILTWKSPTLVSKQTVFKTPQQYDHQRFGKLLYVGKDSLKLQRLLGVFYSMSFGMGVMSLYMLSTLADSTLTVVVFGANVFMFAVANPYGLYQFGKRYVSKLYHNAKTDMYTVELLSPFVVSNRKIQYSPKDCTMPKGPTMFTSYYVKKHPLFVNSDLMNYKDYSEMLRYAGDLDYENPDRQQQYDDVVSDAIKKKQSKSDSDTT